MHCPPIQMTTDPGRQMEKSKSHSAGVREKAIHEFRSKLDELERKPQESYDKAILAFPTSCCSTIACLKLLLCQNAELHMLLRPFSVIAPHKDVYSFHT